MKADVVNPCDTQQAALRGSTKREGPENALFCYLYHISELTYPPEPKCSSHSTPICGYKLTNNLLGPDTALDIVNDAGPHSSGKLKMASFGKQGYTGQHWQFRPHVDNDGTLSFAPGSLVPRKPSTYMEMIRAILTWHTRGITLVRNGG